jgi:hypothetical protein
MNSTSLPPKSEPSAPNPSLGRKAVHFVVGLAALATLGSVGIVALGWGAKKVGLGEPGVPRPEAQVGSGARTMHPMMVELAERARSLFPRPEGPEHFYAPGVCASWDDLSGHAPGTLGIVVNQDNVLVTFLIPKASLERPRAEESTTPELGEVARVLAALSGSPDSTASTHAQILALARKALATKMLSESTPPLDLGVITINGHAWKLDHLKLQDQFARSKPEKRWQLGMCGLAANLDAP